jgi:hypothetical protein
MAGVGLLVITFLALCALAVVFRKIVVPEKYAGHRTKHYSIIFLSRVILLSPGCKLCPCSSSGGNQ